MLGMARCLLGSAPVFLLLASCWGDGGVVGPQPEPVTQPIGIDIALVSMERQDDQTVVTGAPGAVEEAIERIIVDNLDRAAAWGTAPVAADGSFSVSVAGSPDEFFRLDALPRGVVDITSESASGGVAVGADHRDCLLTEALQLPPGPVLDLGEVADSAGETLALRNSCGAAVALSGATLHYGSVGFEAATDLPGTELAPGQTAEVDVVVLCDAPGDRRDLLVIETDGGRAVVTLAASCLP